MRFSLLIGARQRPDLGQTAAQAQKIYFSDALLAEEIGLDAVYFGEHHFCFAGGYSSPLTMIAAVAARTSRIRIGTGVTCAPFHNPLRLAEDIASIDILSGGRFDLGIGVGSQWEEFQTFGIDPKERFGRTWEIIDIIEKCMRSPVDEVFDWKGKYYDFPGVRWIMQPVQKRIPILWGGFGVQGVKQAAERGYHLFAPDVTGTYRKTVEASGRNPRDYLIGFVNKISIADNFDDAIEAVADAHAVVSNEYAFRRNMDGNQPEIVKPFTRADIIDCARRGRASIGEPPKKGERPPPFSVPTAGTVSDIRDYLIKRVRGQHGLITHMCINAREPGVATEHTHRTMRLFAQEIMPALKEEAKRHGV
jgi:alkanesulfonate monooxygenase SsuD/methylene tetrahydromethanopterin reductase-like flavin-dependent oxidoreductase (luciferase family)